MAKPELVLSNTTAFFLGNLSATFRHAKRLGFKYLELVPYRWTTVRQVLSLEKQYGVKAVGIHMPEWWTAKGFRKALLTHPEFKERLFAILWEFYLGPGKTNPGLDLARQFLREKRKFYLLFHTDLALGMGQAFEEIAKTFPVAIENIPYHHSRTAFLWDPREIRKTMRHKELQTRLAFDIGHFEQSIQTFPQISMLETYAEIKPELIHISYNSSGIHTLPNPREQAELVQMLRRHAPQYIVIETNPFVDLRKGKQLLDKLIHDAGF